MDVGKTLEQLGGEYENAARILTIRIKNARKRLASTQNSRLGKEAYLIKSELSTLYGERREAAEIGAALRGYYDKKERGKTA